MARRLSEAAPLPHQQKGLKKEEGCAANIAVLRQLVRGAQKEFSNICIGWIDFKKAFDSVGHTSLSPRLCNYISQLYVNTATSIKSDEAPINISRGVLQRDPPSPFLFNICLAWALTAVPKSIGVELGGNSINYLAFADDVALLASTRTRLQTALDRLAAAARLAGLEVGVKKCASLGVAAHKKKKTWAPRQNRLQDRRSSYPVSYPREVL